MAKSNENQVEQVFVNMLRPRDPKVVLEIAKAHEAGETPDLNQGLYSPEETKAFQDAEDAGTGLAPYIYSPVIVQIGMSRKALFGIRGSAKKYDKKPSNWPTELFGAWEPGFALSKARRYHRKDIHKQVSDPAAIVKIGSYEYIVATTGENGVAAPHLVLASDVGNYRWNEQVSKDIAFAELRKEKSGNKVTKTEFATVVGRINNKPIIYVSEDGRENVCLSNQKITWGHLVSDGKVLTPNQIRKLTEAKGVSFVALAERWFSKGIDKKTLWSAVAKEMKGNKDSEGKSDFEKYESRAPRSVDESKQQKTADSMWTNVNTQTRWSATSANCFGNAYCMIGMPFAWTYEDDGTQGVMRSLGGLTPAGLFTSKRVVNAAIKAAAASAKPKKEKKVKAPAVKAPKVVKEKKAKVSKKSKKAEVVEVIAPVTESTPPTIVESEVVAPAVDVTIASEALGIEITEGIAESNIVVEQ